VLEPTEKDLRIREVVLDCGGNASKAAEVLGLPIGQIYYNLSTQRQRQWWEKLKKDKKELNRKARHRRDYQRRLARARESERYRLD
jgi:hypothetical protein